MRRALAVLASTLVLAGTATVPAHAGSSAGRYADRAFVATNAHRTHVGIAVLRQSHCLHRAAVGRARAMARREQPFHQGLRAVLEGCGLSAVVENVAAGYPTGTSVVDDGWMTSPAHRANILDPQYRLMGIGARQGHDDRWYVSQLFGGRR